MNIKGAIFDADGTLFDSMHIWDGMAEEYVKSIGFVPKKNLTARLQNLTLSDAAKYIHKSYKPNFSITENEKHLRLFIEKRYAKTNLKPGVAKLLQSFYDSGVSMCIATSSARSFIIAAAESNGILKYFKEIISCDSVGKSKQFPDIFEESLKYINTQKETTVVFEDSLYAAQTAIKYGFKVAAIYDFYEKEQEKLKSICNWYFKSFTNVSKEMF